MKALSEGHTYLGTFPDIQAGAVPSWMVGLVHLGARKDVGDTVDVETTAEFFDEGEHDDNPFVSFMIDQTSVHDLHLAIRLPVERRHDLAAEARAVETPQTNPSIIDRWPVPIEDDGWAREDFTALKAGLMYAIVFPGLHLYR